MLSLLSSIFLASIMSPIDPRLSFLTLLIFFASMTTFAQTPERCADTVSALNPLKKYEGTYRFTLDNDLFTQRDQDYTNGVKMAWSSPNLRDFKFDPCLPPFLQQVGQLFDRVYPTTWEDEALVGNVTMTLGQAMFTPRDRAPNELIVDDRPYAGWTYLGFGYNTRTSYRLDSYEVNLGVVGPWSRAKEVQDFVHRVRGIDKFNGWSNQLGNEFGAQLVYERKYRFDFFDDVKARTGFGIDVIPHIGFSLGNVATYANAGFEARIGWGLPDDFGTSPIRPAGDNSAPRAKGSTAQFTRDIGAHVFVAATGRAVARNIFLDGNNIRDSHSVKKEKLVGDLAGGVSFNVSRYKVAFVRVWRTREFAGQITSPRYGSITISGPL
jgi:lipid A 3-O-deacylase